MKGGYNPMYFLLVGRWTNWGVGLISEGETYKWASLYSV